MEERFYKRYESFKRSLDALAEARQRDMSDSFVLSGTTAKFSITMDLAWKVMKDIIVGYYEITDFVRLPKRSAEKSIPGKADQRRRMAGNAPDQE